MQIVIEFTGVARVLTRTESLSLDLPEGTSFRTIVKTLGTMYPMLVGEVIQPDGRTLYPSNMFNLNGKHMVRPVQMNHSPQDGDRIVMMSILAGG
jgi:molybdopterin converting factor small subunit